MPKDNGDATTGSDSAVSSAEEHRDRQIWWALVAVGLVVFVGVIALGRPLVAGRLTAARNLDKATAIIADTDAQLEDIDRAVLITLSTATPQASVEEIKVLWAARRKLEEASSLSQLGYDRLTSDEQKRAAAIAAMAKARLESLVPAEMALSNGGGVRDQAVTEYEQAVKKVRQADAALEKL